MSLFTVVTRNNSYQLPATKLIVGLGNVGSDYESTRHNAGFMALDHFAAEHNLPSFSLKKNLNCYLSEGKIEDCKIILAKPTTLMNLSGKAVLALQNYFELGIDQILIVHDDIDINFGKIKTKKGGGNGGHKGLKSIDNLIGEDYARIRIGVADEHRDKIDASDFVLKNFPKKQLAKLDSLFDKTDNLILSFIDDGFESITVEIE